MNLHLPGGCRSIVNHIFVTPINENNNGDIDFTSKKFTLEDLPHLGKFTPFE
jgi:hypothetical protein